MRYHLAGDGRRAPARPQPCDTWAKKGISAAERFNWLYSDEELRDLAGTVNGLGERTKEPHVIFDNCYRDNAQRNALMLQGLMNR